MISPIHIGVAFKAPHHWYLDLSRLLIGFTIVSRAASVPDPIFFVTRCLRDMCTLGRALLMPDR